MPELPEVEIVRRGLDPAIMDKHVKNIILNRSDLRGGIPVDLVTTIAQRKIISTKRRGKYILAFTNSGAGFVLHLGMSGRVKIYEPGRAYHSEKHDHVVFTMEDDTRIIYNDPRRFGMLYLTHADRWDKEAPFDVMGPEPLEENFTGAALHERLGGRKTSVKNALLDQKVVAGIGNIYACEALYESGISPLREAQSVSAGESDRLAPALRSVLTRALQAGGSSLKDYRHTDDGLGYFQHSFSVYDRQGVACPACDCDMVRTGGVKRIVQGGRSSFYCESRQK